MKLKFLAENIQIKLNEKNISVREFERLAGLKRSTLANILSGSSKNPTIEVLLSIANKLECPIEELLESGFPEGGTRSINVNPKDLEEDTLFFEITILLAQKLKSLGIRPSFQRFTNCSKEIFFHATHIHKNRFTDEDFLFWVIKQHFPSDKREQDP